jgi:hypothetical protein
MVSTPEDDLLQYLEDHMVKFRFGYHTQEFLPRDTFEEATSRLAIEKTILEVKDELGLSTQELDEFATCIHQSGRKLFAACVWSGVAMTCLKRLLAKGFTDLNPPRVASDCDCPNLNTRLQRTFRSFLNDLKKFNAPFFATNSFQVLGNDIPIPIEFVEGSASLCGRGAFGEVRKMNIHRAHHNLLPVGAGTCSISSNPPC